MCCLVCELGVPRVRATIRREVPTRRRSLPVLHYLERPSTSRKSRMEAGPGASRWPTQLYSMLCGVKSAFRKGSGDLQAALKSVFIHAVGGHAAEILNSDC